MTDYGKLIKAYGELKTTIAPHLLAQYRGARSYAKVAAELNCSRTYIWKIEHAQEIISDEHLLRLLVLMGVK